MLAAAGWPLSELLDGPLSQLLGLPTLLGEGGRAPAVWGLTGPQGGFVMLALLGTAVLELRSKTLDNVAGLTPTGYVPGDLGWDPAGLRASRDEMEVAEIKNGRLAMLAVAGYLVHEANPEPKPEPEPDQNANSDTNPGTLCRRRCTARQSSTRRRSSSTRLRSSSM